MAMTRNLRLWASILVVWVVLALGLVAMESAGQIAIGTMVFLQALAVVLAVTAYIFTKKTGELSDTEEIEKLLYGSPTEKSEDESHKMGV
jgi:hypothetical protein